jgi:hypothetical protein
MTRRPAAATGCAILVALVVHGRLVSAQTPELSEGWRAQPRGSLMIDAGLLTSPAAALGPSLSTGVAAGVSKGGWIAWQVRASWSSATESSIAWTVTQAELRLRAGGVIQHPLGRAQVGLRLGFGPSIVHETRARNMSTLETSAFSAIPAADLEAVLALHVWSRWLVVMSGGPDASWSGGAPHAGWLAQLGVGWQP